jgi:hypothetical protein
MVSPTNGRGNNLTTETTGKYWLVVEAVLGEHLDQCYAGLYGPYEDRQQAEAEVDRINSGTYCKGEIVEFDSAVTPMPSDPDD